MSNAATYGPSSSLIGRSDTANAEVFLSCWLNMAASRQALSVFDGTNEISFSFNGGGSTTDIVAWAWSGSSLYNQIVTADPVGYTAGWLWFGVNVYYSGSNIVLTTYRKYGTAGTIYSSSTTLTKAQWGFSGTGVTKVTVGSTRDSNACDYCYAMVRHGIGSPSNATVDGWATAGATPDSGAWTQCTTLWVSGAPDSSDISGNARAWTVSGTPAQGATAPTLGSGPTAVTATGIATTPSVGSPTVSQVHALTATGIATTPSVGSPAVTQAHVLSSTGLAATPTVGTPSASQVYVLTATGIATTPTVGAPAVTQIHALSATGLAAVPTVGAPAASQAHVLTATGIAATPTVGTASVGQIHALVAVGLVATPTVSVPTIFQTHTLAALGIETTPMLGSPDVDPVDHVFPYLVATLRTDSCLTAKLRTDSCLTATLRTF